MVYGNYLDDFKYFSVPKLRSKYESNVDPLYKYIIPGLNMCNFNRFVKFQCKHCKAYLFVEKSCANLIPIPH